jgi:hypothetical protein
MRFEMPAWRTPSENAVAYQQCVGKVGIEDPCRCTDVTRYWMVGATWRWSNRLEEGAGVVIGSGTDSDLSVQARPVSGDVRCGMGVGHVVRKSGRDASVMAIAYRYLSARLVPE